jgi:hypothetical protein
VGGQSGFAACPPHRKLLKPSGEQALRPAFIRLLWGAEFLQKKQVPAGSPGLVLSSGK